MRRSSIFQNWQQLAKAEDRQEGTTRALSFHAPSTGKLISVSVSLTFTDERFGGRRAWFECPECPRRVRFLFGGRPCLSKPYTIASDQLDPVIQLVEAEMVGACLECHASGRVL